jgi:XTP/dITP diphosphohydrolase
VTLPLPLVLATQNADKAREIVEVFVAATDVPLGAYCVEGVGFVVDDPAALAGTVDALPALETLPNVEETGATLAENARIKACAVGDALGMLAIADDTGLEVDALEGAPGVRSARYAGERATYAQNTAKLLRELEGVYPALRTARFVTVAVAYRPGDGEQVVRGTVEGIIAPTPHGEGGFGYDPVFVPTEGDGHTFAEMAPERKHAISHRGRAFRALAAALTEGS